MVRIKSFNEKLISYLSSEKNNEDLVGEAMLFKDKFNTRREENTYVSPSSDVKNVSYPTKNRRSSSFYRYKQKNGYQCQRSTLHNSFTADSLFEESINNKPEVTSTTAMTAVVKRNKSTKGFFSSLTKKILNNKRSSISRKYSTHIHNGKLLTKKSSKFLISASIGRNANNIPMQVVETLYTISFTKHSYYIQRSLRRSTMIVNLITRFRNTYEELREIDVPKLKRRISFKKRVPNNKAVKKADQPKEGSLIELREQRRARYYSHFGDAIPYSTYSSSYLQNYSQYSNTVSTVDTVESTNVTYETMNTNTTVESVSHTSPRRRKKMPRKPLLEFSECESLPSIPASAAGSKVNHYLVNHKETERKKLKPIKSIDKELCLIFNKEYIPEEKINQNTESVTKLHKGTSCEDLRSTVQQQETIYSKHSSINLPITSIPEIAPLPAYEEPEDEEENEIGPEDISIFIEEGKVEEKKPEPIPSPSSATTEVYIPEEEDKKERKRISDGTLYREALDEKHPGNVSAESDSSDKTLKEEEISIPSSDSSFLVVDESVHQINFHIDSEEESDSSEDEKQSFVLKFDNNCQSKSNDKHEDSFSLTDSFLLNDNSEDSIIPEHMSKFLLNKNYSLSDDDFFNDSMSILNNSLINETFTLTLNNYGDNNNNNDKSYIDNIDTETSFLKKDEKSLSRIDSGVDLSGMENISILMAAQCQI